MAKELIMVEETVLKLSCFNEHINWYRHVNLLPDIIPLQAKRVGR